MPQLPFTYGRRARGHSDSDSDSEDPPPKVLTVSQLQRVLRNELESRHRNVLVAGEISNLQINERSGHAYFTLKDRRAQLKCVMWRESLSRIRFRPTVGQDVVIRGKVTVYEQGGSLQLNAVHIEPQGLGALQQEFEQRVEKLRLEGLTSDSRKRPLPAHPTCIGLVTSRSGAALRDILRTILRRDPFARVILSSTPVQGRGAAFRIVSALERLDALVSCEVIIVARGGGSTEDLWCFNEEPVARAIAKSSVPVVTGIGHETDTTIADLVADVRTSTPTAAAEHVVPIRSEVRERWRALEDRLHRNLRSRLEHYERRLLSLKARLKDPEATIKRRAQYLDELSTRAERAARGHTAGHRDRFLVMERRLDLCAPTARLRSWTHRLKLLETRQAHAISKTKDDAQSRFSARVQRLHLLSPLNVLSRGYALVQTEEGAVVRAPNDVDEGDHLNIRLAEGTIDATVSEKKK